MFVESSANEHTRGFSLKMSIYLCILPRQGCRIIAITSAYTNFIVLGRQGAVSSVSKVDAPVARSRRPHMFAISRRGVSQSRAPLGNGKAIDFVLDPIRDDRSRLRERRTPSSSVPTVFPDLFIVTHPGPSFAR